MATQVSGYVLGLDIGVASIGWAVLDTDASGTPVSIRHTGVHLFEAGIDPGKSDPETALLQGREQSKAAPRREARAMRRQTWRRTRRKRKLLHALMRAELLPIAPLRTPEDVHQYLCDVDARLRSQWIESTHVSAQNLPYRIRAAAAVRSIEAEAFGRALYHLAQRRGFLSNRKSPEREGEDRSKMKQQIGDLAKAIAAHNPPTLGSYLASLDPDDNRLRSRWTARSMFKQEFDCLWRTQAEHLGLTEDQRAEIYRAIFDQRPLRSQSHLIGRCLLIPGSKRCPMSERIAQRFRVFQQVNHLRVVMDDFSERPLTAEEREALSTTLLTDGDLTIRAAKKAAGLPMRCTLSIERGGEKRLIGHRTDAALRKAFSPDRWDGLTEAEKDHVVHAVRSFRQSGALTSWVKRKHGLDQDAARTLGDVSLEEGNAAHCRKALARLASRMEHDGLSYSEARKDEYPESFASTKPLESLPPVTDWEQDLANPSVARALTEVRKVVNAVVRRWGKPIRVHVELARDLKSGKSRREKASRRMRERQREREQAAAVIAREIGIQSPSRWMVEKWLLAEECGWLCPYTGRHFGAEDLLGETSQFDVEHIWPMSQSLDNSYLNKTICYHEENRSRKKGRSPSAAYSDDELAVIADRVRAFKGDPFATREKLRRFLEPAEDGYTARHLQETRYIGRLACDYIGLLFGGRSEDVGDSTRTQRIVAPTGVLTAWLRRGWGLDAVLSSDSGKNREDHRHHAVDAVVIACTGPSAIKRVADAAKRMEHEHRERPFDAIDVPWVDFVTDVKKSVEKIVVSARISKRVRGGLHKDTIYSKPHIERKGLSHHRSRTELAVLNSQDLERGRIVDPRAEAIIRAKLEELGEKNPAKAFKDPANLPVVRGDGGKMVTLRRVRMRESVHPRQIGSGATARLVKSESNYHTVVYATKNKDGRELWAHKVVPLIDAMDAIKQHVRERHYHEPLLIAPELPSNARVLFTLANGECLEMEDPKQPGVRDVFRVLSISNGEIKVIRTYDGRASAKSGKDRIRIRGAGDNLRKLGARKVRVTILGGVVDAG
ncbi:MAG: type II CRISPR RNA-guided endonuclease Cas9 [Planctomycetota bacterium]